MHIFLLLALAYSRWLIAGCVCVCVDDGHAHRINLQLCACVRMPLIVRACMYGTLNAIENAIKCIQSELIV